MIKNILFEMVYDRKKEKRQIFMDVLFAVLLVVFVFGIPSPILCFIFCIQYFFLTEQEYDRRKQPEIMQYLQFSPKERKGMVFIKAHMNAIFSSVLLLVAYYTLCIFEGAEQEVIMECGIYHSISCYFLIYWGTILRRTSIWSVGFKSACKWDNKKMWIAGVETEQEKKFITENIHKKEWICMAVFVICALLQSYYCYLKGGGIDFAWFGIGHKDRIGIGIMTAIEWVTLGVIRKMLVKALEVEYEY